MAAFVGLLHVTFATVTLHSKTALSPSITVIAGDTLITGLTVKQKSDTVKYKQDITIFKFLASKQSKSLMCSMRSEGQFRCTSFQSTKLMLVRPEYLYEPSFHALI